MDDNKVVPFQKKDKTCHTTGDAKCLACDNEWVAVVPVGVQFLECPKCKTMRGVFNYPPHRNGINVWTCGTCRGTCFEFYEDAMIGCIKCGHVCCLPPGFFTC